MPESAEPSPQFQVGRLALVNRQIRLLIEKARALGIDHEVVSCLKVILQKLATAPLAWGDPLYATKLPGGLVFRGFYSLFFVHYIVYEPQRLVLITEIQVKSGHPLDNA